MSDLLLPRLRPDQWAIALHPAKTKVVAMGRRWGKSTMAGAICVAAANDGGHVAWIVPTYKNARPAWRWVDRVCAPLEREGAVRINRTERFVEFPRTGGLFSVYSADNDVGLRGDWLNLAVLEEAARIREETYTEVVLPMLADADGDCLLPSTPMGRNWFWREWRRGYAQMDGEMAAFTAPSSANPMPTIQRAAALAQQRVPENVYRQEWLAEFIDDSFDLFDRAWFDERRFVLGELLPPSRIVGRYLSWDTAFKDTDTAAYSACVVGELTDTYELRIVDVWRDRVTFPHLLAHMRRLRARHNTDGKLRAELIEDKASGTSAYQTLLQEARPDDAAQLVAFQPQGSKDQRAAQAAVWCTHGLVWLPHPSPAAAWLLPFEEELFRQGPFFDQRDAFAQLVLFLEHYLSSGLHARRAALVPATGATEASGGPTPEGQARAFLRRSGLEGQEF